MDIKHSDAEAAKRVFGGAITLPDDWRLHRGGLDHELCRTSTNQEMEEEKLGNTYPNSLHRCIDRRGSPKDHERDIRHLLLARTCARLVVQHRRVDVAKRYTAQTKKDAAGA